MWEDKIIGALIGLVGACANNPKTTRTDGIIIKSLAALQMSPNLDDGIAHGMIQEIHAEKNAVAPNCAHCPSPCGNTSDYDMRRVYEAGEEIRRAKLQILDGLKGLAVDIYQSGGESDKVGKFFYRALSYIGYDMEEASLRALLSETERWKKEIHIRRRKGND